MSDRIISLLSPNQLNTDSDVNLSNLIFFECILEQSCLLSAGKVSMMGTQPEFPSIMMLCVIGVQNQISIN